MKKYIHIVISVLLFIYTLPEGFGQIADHSKLAVSVNPMGLLFFGPSLNLAWSINEKTVINANFRRNSWGYLARKIRESDSSLFSFKGMGYAIGCTRFVKTIESGMYYGAFLSLDIQNTKYLENSAFQTHEKTKTYGLLLNAGKRFKIGSRYYLNAGAVFGAGLVKFHWEYDDLSVGFTDTEARMGNSIIPIGSVELGFGMFIF